MRMGQVSCISINYFLYKSKTKYVTSVKSKNNMYRIFLVLGKIELREMLDIVGTLYEMQGVENVSYSFLLHSYFLPSFIRSQQRRELIICLAKWILMEMEKYLRRNL